MGTTTWTMNDGLVRANNGLHWAHYTAAGERVACGTDFSCTPTAAELAAWDAEAPARAIDAVAAHEAKQVRMREAARIAASTKGAFKARFDGTCDATGRAYGRGTMIVRYGDGWAIADVTSFPATPLPRTGSVLGGEFDGDEQDALDDEMRIARTEGALG